MIYTSIWYAASGNRVDYDPEVFSYTMQYARLDAIRLLQKHSKKGKCLIISGTDDPNYEVRYDPTLDKYIGRRISADAVYEIDGRNGKLGRRIHGKIM